MGSAAGCYKTIGEALSAVDATAFCSIAVAAGVYRERVFVPCGVEVRHNVRFVLTTSVRGP